MELLWGLGGVVAGVIVPLVILWRTNTAHAKERQTIQGHLDTARVAQQAAEDLANAERSSNESAKRAMLAQKDELDRTARSLRTAQTLYTALAQKLVASKDPQLVSNLINRELQNLKDIGKT